MKGEMSAAPVRDIRWFVLAHSRASHADRCLHLRLGSRRIALCARCAGLYPVLGAVLGVQAWNGAPPVRSWDYGLALPGVVVALVDWGLGWMGARRGTPRLRLGTGIVLGISLGRGLWLYFRDPLSPVFWVQMGLVGAGVLVFEILRRRRRR